MAETLIIYPNLRYNLNMLKIAVDGGPLKSGDRVRGIGVYTRELLKALKMEGVDVSGSDLSKYDVIHFTRFNPFFISVPFKKPEHVKFVLTIYDLIPLIYPDHYPPGIRGMINWQINKFLIRKNIDAVITISETSKKDICRFIGINPSKVYVTHLAPRPIFRREASQIPGVAEHYRLPEHFALYVGDVNYNKNIPNLVKSCKMAKIRLVIVGKQALEIENLNLEHPELSHLKDIDWSGVLRLGFVPDEDLVKIYNLADVYVQPSLYEGFGLPVLEANAVGIPVVSSKIQALVEIAEDATLFANPESPEDLAEKIKLLLNDSKLKNELIQKGSENAKKYSWKKTAEETDMVYRKINNF